MTTVTAPLDLAGLTPYSASIIRLAESKELAAHWAQPHGNARRLVLNGVGPHGTFGHIEFGRRSGKVLRASLTFGNGGRTVTAKGTNAVRGLLDGLRVTYCAPGCNAPTDRNCRP